MVARFICPAWWGKLGASVAEQTHQILAQVETLLSEAGTDNKHLLRAVIWLDDMKHFAAMNEVWDAWVPEGYAPTRACGEARLARPELHVEIIITAALPA